MYKKFQTSLLVAGVILSLYLLRPALTVGFGISAPDEYSGFSALQLLLTSVGLYSLLSMLLFFTSILLFATQVPQRRMLLVCAILVVVFAIHGTTLGSALAPSFLYLMVVPAGLIFTAYSIAQSKSITVPKRIIAIITIVGWVLFFVAIAYFTLYPIAAGIKVPDVSLIEI